MKKFWVFYISLLFILLKVLFSVGLNKSTAAAPGNPVLSDLVHFESFADDPDPNETLKLVNQIRTANKLPALLANQQLGRIARARTTDMVTRSYYAHQNPNGNFYFDYFPNHNIRAGYSCENLNLIFIPDQNRVIEEWLMSSKGHKECLLNSKTSHAGYATARLTTVDYKGDKTTSFVFVAIHAEL